MPGQGFIARQPLRRRSPGPCRHRFKEKTQITHLESQLPRACILVYIETTIEPDKKGGFGTLPLPLIVLSQTSNTSCVRRGNQTNSTSQTGNSCSARDGRSIQDGLR